MRRHCLLLICCLRAATLAAILVIASLDQKFRKTPFSTSYPSP